ncbi:MULTISPECIES: DUF29 domain-containing protein [unclassified Endozoicomonas]|uniref:DUF29 domain-containing protein n=1 Tax=unclassified Endozoicomonas TaxID=2644528 RepID=UPI0021487B4E|nr:MULTISPECIES: DUF29 domain-containing protein [unclassified Endozoicomonas]
MDGRSNQLFDSDYYQWVQQQKKLLENRQFDQLDLDNLIEEVGEMGKSERNSFESHLIILLLHLLKYDYQLRVLQDPWVQDKVIHTWLPSITNPRIEIKTLLRKSPYLNKIKDEALAEAYFYARKDAVQELNKYIRSEGKRLDKNSFPKECPWSFDQVMEINWLPE